MTRPEVMPLSAQEAAVDWLLLREARSLTSDERESFQTWLESAENRQAYADLERLWAVTGEVESHPRFAEKRREVLGSVNRRRIGRRAIAASLAAGLLGLGSFGLLNYRATRPLADQSFQTGVGQRATVTLPDGSAITLNTDTVVRTRADADRRLVYLERGQAFFRVAHDWRHPFVVAAAGRTVTALGTAFDVRVDKGGLKVILVEGRVRVAAPARPAQIAQPSAGAPPPDRATEMTAGSELVATTDADWRLTRTDVKRETSWLYGQLVFDDEPLGDVVAELNRYTTRKIVLADARLADRRISGIYMPGDIQGFSHALKVARVGEVSEENEGQVLIVPLK